MSRTFGPTGRWARLPRLSLTLAILLLALPGAVQAASPTITNDLVLIAACGRISGADGTIDLGLSVPRDREAHGSLTYWVPGADPDVDEPALLGFASFTLRQASPTRIEGDLDVIRLDDGERFLAPISVDFASAGEPELVSIEDRFGNVTTRMTFGTEPMTVTAGSLALGDGLTFDLTGCSASRGTAEIWQTAPKATMIDGATTDIECTWQGDGLYAVLLGEETPFESKVALYLETTDGVWAGGGTPTMTEEQLLADFELSGASEGSATVVVDLAPTTLERTYVQVIEDARTRVTDTILTASGDVTVTAPGLPTLGLSLADATCSALRSEFHGVMRSTSAAVPRAPANDLPDAAEPLRERGTASVHTGGAAFEGEARSECLSIDGEVNAFVHTAWYSVMGTGAPITLDTAGSDFDTGIAVYVRDAEGGFDEIACSNTVFLEPVGAVLQGRVTFDTEAGKTYYVQAGGFLPESGHLIVRRS